jgi:hypothetical protein
MDTSKPGDWAGWASTGWSDRVGLTDVGPAQKKRKGLLFSEFNFQCENNSRKSRNCFKGTKNTQKIPRIPGKFLEIGWNMNNPKQYLDLMKKILDPSNK